MSQYVYGHEAATCEENIQFSFDNRDWIQAFENQKDKTSIVEYIVKGDNIDHWSELVSVQKLVPLGATSVDQYYDEYVKALKIAVSPTEVHSRVIHKNDSPLLKDNFILFEWWIDGESPDAQHEWFKLIKTPHSTWVLRYTTKKLNDVEKVRKTWEKILDEATYTTNGQCKN